MKNFQRKSNRFWSDGDSPPKVSVVVPFFEYDTSKLARKLCDLAAGLSIETEIIFADDGSKNPAFAAQVERVFEDATVPCLLVLFPINMGRSSIRNQLAQIARGEHLVFLDCDMMPDDANFLKIYANIAIENKSDIVYGGHSAKQTEHFSQDYDLHRAFTERRENLSADKRKLQPVYHFYSCNFLVRRSVVLSIPFSEQFKGWGWEDGEWAANAATTFKLDHIDNLATHLGLQSPDDILLKYEKSLDNFSLMLRLQPVMITGTQLYKAARFLKTLRIGRLIEYLARKGVLMNGLPIGMRINCLMWFKAALYSRLV